MVPLEDENALAYCGKQLRMARLARGWTLDDVAQRVGLSRSSISALELGQQWLRVEMLLALAAVLDVPRAALFPPETASEVQRMLTLLLTTPPAMRTALLNLLETYHMQYPQSLLHD